MRPTNMHIDMPVASQGLRRAVAINSAGLDCSARDCDETAASSSSSLMSANAAFAASISATTSGPRTPLLDGTPPTTPLFTHPPGFSGGSLFGGGVVGRRPSLLRRDSSVSSVASSVGDEEEEDDKEWTIEEQDKIRTALENYIESVDHAPFASAHPPSNLPSIVARSVIHSTNRELRARARQQAQEAAQGSSMEVEGASSRTVVPTQKWPHGIRSTRKKVLAIVKEKQQFSTESTPRQDTDETPKRRKGLARQGSMDFLPTARNVSVVARLGSKLHRAEQAGPPLSASAIHSYTSRPRAFRTASLSSIAGSPTQPERPPARPVTFGSPVKSSAMQRIGSDSTGSHHAEFAHLPSPGMKSMGALWSEPSSANSKSIFDLSFGGHSSSSTTPKRSNTSGLLGAAFATPNYSAAYPSPISQKKAKHHHSTLDSSEQPALSSPFGSSFPSDVQEIATTFVPRPESAPPVVRVSGSPTKRRSSEGRRGGRLGMSESWAEHLSSSSSSSSLSSDSASSTDSHKLYPSSSISSLSSFDSNRLLEPRGPSPFQQCGSPSPLSSTFDLNDLSLEALGEEKHKLRAAGSYLEAGEQEQEMRQRLMDWGGWTAQSLGARE